MRLLLYFLLVEAKQRLQIGEGAGQHLKEIKHREPPQRGGQITGGRFAIVSQVAPAEAGSRSTSTTRKMNGSMFSRRATFWIGGKVIVALEGSFVFGPRGIPRTIVVSSSESRFCQAPSPPAAKTLCVNSPSRLLRSLHHRPLPNRPPWKRSSPPRPDTESKSRAARHS